MIKKIMRHISIGVLIGSFIFLLMLLTQMKPVTVTPEDIIRVFVMSALIGVLSMIFSIERLNFFVAILIHYVGVILIVGLSNNIIDMLGNPFVYLTEITVIYVIVWIILRISTGLNVRSINNALKRKRQKK
ncbi:DUF3021 family protein [Dellaglioa algida]|uniref:DUF3021 family protein n=1 Tax=Dellaglioa algida TaxID=105612 RepID=UPI000BCCF2B2|nr:DUF3021 family protein [Dellaglioa algida]MDK1717930.1 DUF3021 domain-containing protein [Dellaglioa algida]MDK1729878.1 DUF3021 domain-containing protein [Dellaglioa algida]MDK1742312.1 DUF3021 domain-containing protein [Dellaglioa algida]SOB49081.1 conserved membrane hypothetical protein [Dellaglioa algida]